jgi:hypothetical protein
MELDTCTSSDALLMNIFCSPGLSRGGKVEALLRSDPGTSPCFGYKARVPLANGKFDRTEVDLRLENLLVEAKLTEGDFQTAKKQVLLSYRDFLDVSIRSNCLKRKVISSPTSFSETCSRLMLWTLRSAHWLTREGRI